MLAYFAENIWLIWLLVSIVCLLLELTSGDLFILCFAIGAVASSVASAFGIDLVWQIVIGVAVAILSLYFVRPPALRWLHRNEDNRLSNAEAIIGRTGKVSETIEAGGFGRVAIDGDDWKAQSVDSSQIKKGEKVRVVGMESIIITVEKSD